MDSENANPEKPFFRALPDVIKNHLASSLTLIELPRGVADPSFDRLTQIYFPASCVFSISARMPKAPSVFMKFAGRDSVVGLGSIPRTATMIYELRLIGSGYAHTVPESHLLKMFDSAENLGSFQYESALTAAELTMISAVCRGSHTTSQRLARVLLEASDAFGPDRPITLTQAELGRLLSVTRESVVGFLSRLSRAGAVIHRRGQISVHDRSRLLDLSCRCYEAAQRLEARALRGWKEAQWSKSSRPLVSNSPANRLPRYLPPRRAT